MTLSLRWASCTFCLLSCRMRAIAGDSGCCFCVHVTSFERYLTPFVPPPPPPPTHTHTHPKGRPGMSDVPSPCLEFQSRHLIPLSGLLSLVFLSSPLALSVFSFFLLMVHSLDFFQKILKHFLLMLRVSFLFLFLSFFLLLLLYDLLSS